MKINLQAFLPLMCLLSITTAIIVPITTTKNVVDTAQIIFHKNTLANGSKNALLVNSVMKLSKPTQLVSSPAPGS
jgi:hypothetical protein